MTMRVNPTTPVHIHPVNYHNDLGSKEARGRMPFVKRIREKNEATGLAMNVWSKGSYRTGDGEVPQAQRPGSERAYTLPSKGAASCI